jgi:hypothetical protein
LHRGADACYDRANEGGPSAADTVGEEAREEDVGEPGAQVVDCCDEALLGGGGRMQGFEEAGGDVDGGYDSDVVSILL